MELTHTKLELAHTKLERSRNVGRKSSIHAGLAILHASVIYIYIYIYKNIYSTTI